jgi:nucleoside-diphosphate kinase
MSILKKLSFWRFFMEQTLSIIKPDAVAKNVIGEILSRFEKHQLKIVAAKMVHLTKEQAKKFYAVHQGKPFFADLVNFISSGPVLVTVLQGPDAVQKNRKIMGATDPKKADKGTIRADFASSIDQNAVHGSDSVENAKIEISFFFAPSDIFSR